MKRKVLVVAYYFPPLAMGGVQRVAKFCKYLPDYGWEPIVLTSIPRSYYAFDFSFSEELKDTLVYEAGSPFGFSPASGESFENWRARVKGFAGMAFVPDVRVGWVPFAFEVGLKLLKVFPIECIFATAPPYSSLLVARLLSRASGRPLVVDFRDAWVDDPSARYPTALHRKANEILEHWVIDGAAKVISIGDQIVAGIRDRWDGGHEKYELVNQGFDPADFDQVVERADRFVVCYTGSLLGPRKPDDIFLAVSQLVLDGRIDPTQIEIDLAGFCPSAFGKTAQDLGLGEIVKLRGYLPHMESVRHLIRADVLWLYIAASEGATILTGKLFEYLGSGKKIIASVPPNGAAASVVRSLGAGVVVQPGDIEALKEAVLESYTAWLRGEQSFAGCASLESYDRRLLAWKLSRILDGVSARRRGRSQRCSIS